MRLTKTDILSGLKCKKQIFLSKNHPEFRKPTNITAKTTGQIVDDHSRRIFDNAVLVSGFKPDTDPFDETQNLISNSSYDAIFQAGFFAEDNDYTLFINWFNFTKTLFKFFCSIHSSCTCNEFFWINHVPSTTRMDN